MVDLHHWLSSNSGMRRGRKAGLCSQGVRYGLELGSGSHEPTGNNLQA